MEVLTMKKLLLLALALGACKWTEFDDLRDEAWARAITKRDGSKSSNWGVGLARSGLQGDDGGSLVIVGTLTARVDQANLAPDGDAQFESADLDLGNLAAVDALSAEPIVISDPNSSDYSIVTVSSNGAVVVVEGSGLNLLQNVINKTSGALDGAAYMVPPAANSTNDRAGRTAAASQVLIASGTRLFGTFSDPRPATAFDQVLCDTSAVTGNIRAIGAVRRDPANTTDDIAVWTENGDILLLDGHLFNGAQSGNTVATGGTETALCPGGAAEGIFAGPPLATAVPTDTTPFIPAQGSLAQILTFGGHFAILQGHDAQNGYLQLWDFGTDDTPGIAAGVPIGNRIDKPGVKFAALIEIGGKTFVAIGVPGAVVDGVTTGQVEIYEVDPVMGILSPPVDTLSDAQPEDGEAFGRAITAVDYNGQQVLAIGASNEVFVYYRTPNLYNTDARRP
jgi:hypothetical protein